MQLTYPDGSIVTRSYTARNLLQQVDYDADGSGGIPASSVASFSYDPGGRESSRTHGNGIVTNRTYNRQDNLVTSIDVAGYPGLSFSYSYDENKNVTAETTGGVMAGYSRLSILRVVGALLVVQAASPTLLAPAPRSDGTLRQTRLSPLAEALSGPEKPKRRRRRKRRQKGAHQPRLPVAA